MSTQSDVEPRRAHGNSRITATQYGHAKMKYASGDFTLKEIAADYGISPQALGQRFRRDGVEKGSMIRQLESAVDASVDASAMADSSELAEMAKGLKKQYYGFVDALTRAAMSEIAGARQKNEDVALRDPALRSYERASKMLATNYDTQMRILGIEKLEGAGNALPEIRVISMSSEDEAALRTAAESDDLDEEDLMAIEDGVAGEGAGEELQIVADDEIVDEGSDDPPADSNARESEAEGAESDIVEEGLDDLDDDDDLEALAQLDDD